MHATLLFTLIVLVVCAFIAGQDKILLEPTQIQVEPAEEQASEQLASTVNNAVLQFTVDIDLTRPEIRKQMKDEANKLEQLANSIPETDDESKQVKATLLTMATSTRKMTVNIGQKILTSTINETLAEKKKELTDGELWQLAVSIGSGVANFVNDVGTFAGKLSNTANFVSNKVAPWLDKKGLGGVGNLARTVGGGIKKTSEFIAPMEQKLAKSLAPVRNNQAFQNARRVLNVADAAIGLTGVAKNVYNGYKVVKNLPSMGKTVAAVTSNGLAIAKQGVIAMRSTRKTFQVAKKTINTVNSIRGIEGNVKKVGDGITGKGYQVKRTTPSGRAAPRTAPRPAPRTAPRAAPRAAPRIAPRTAPRAAPRAAP